MKRYILPGIICLFIFSIYGQNLTVPSNVQTTVDDALKQKIVNSLDSLLQQVDRGELTDQYIHPENAGLTISMLGNLQGIDKKDSVAYYYQKQLLNLYPIAEHRYFVSFAYLDNRGNGAAVINTIFNIIADASEENITFTLPLMYFTEGWQSKTIGNIKYIYRDGLKIERAKKFDEKNRIIAKKMGVPAEKFTFFMCKNYQEFLRLVGYEYSLASSGQTRDGYGVDSGFIFSIMHHEDFSHDIFHYYSGKINERKNRNWVTEEGIAYHWGNAYYNDPSGEAISNKRLIDELKKYLAAHPQAGLYDLFVNRPKIFAHIAPEVSVRSAISGVICAAVEKAQGMDGLMKLINAGREPNHLDTYFAALADLTGITKLNFDQKVGELVAAY